MLDGRSGIASAALQSADSVGDGGAIVVMACQRKATATTEQHREIARSRRGRKPRQQVEVRRSVTPLPKNGDEGQQTSITQSRGCGSL